jgi:hypothetical protein
MSWFLSLLNPVKKDANIGSTGSRKYYTAYAAAAGYL